MVLFLFRKKRILTAELKVSMFGIIAKTSEYSLSAKQEKELFSAYDESLISSNHATHEEAQRKHSKWLKK